MEDKLYIETNNTLEGKTSLDMTYKGTMKTEKVLYSHIEKTLFDLRGGILWDNLFDFIMDLSEEFKPESDSIKLKIDFGEGLGDVDIIKDFLRYELKDNVINKVQKTLGDNNTKVFINGREVSKSLKTYKNIKELR